MSGIVSVRPLRGYSKSGRRQNADRHILFLLPQCHFGRSIASFIVIIIGSTSSNYIISNCTKIKGGEYSSMVDISDNILHCHGLYSTFFSFISSGKPERDGVILDWSLVYAQWGHVHSISLTWMVYVSKMMVATNIFDSILMSFLTLSIVPQRLY